MLDNKYGNTLFLNLRDQGKGFLYLCWVQTRHHLIEEEQFRLCGKRPGNLQSLSIGYGEAPREHAFRPFEADELGRFPGSVTRLNNVFRPIKGTNHDILEYGHITKGLHHLKRPPNPFRTRLMRQTDIGNILSIEEYLAIRFGEYRCNEIKHGGFPRPVRANQSEYFSLSDAETQVIDGGQPSEPFRQIFCLQYCLTHFSRLRQLFYTFSVTVS